MAHIERRQRWAAFSVRAHRDVASLAADILLYDRIILPVPEDEPEYERWIRKEWNPNDIAPRIIQSAGHIIPVPWTAELRQEWQTRAEALNKLGDEVAYGLTGVIYASYPPAWNEIAASLQPDQLPERKPAILAGYQSAEEAKAELMLTPAAAEPGGRKPNDQQPGGRPADVVVALHIHRIVHEPDVEDPEEAFLTAVKLVENPRFQRARRNLFDWEDALYADDWDPVEVERELRGLEEQYRDAVRSEARQTRRRRIATLLPKAAGWGIALAGYPHAKTPVSKSLSFVAGRFLEHETSAGPEMHPGAALEMIRAAYRHEHPEPAADRP